jgi:hypothetical protein
MTNPCSYSVKHSIYHKTWPHMRNVFRASSEIFPQEEQSFLYTKMGQIINSWYLNAILCGERPVQIQQFCQSWVNFWSNSDHFSSIFIELSQGSHLNQEPAPGYCSSHQMSGGSDTASSKTLDNWRNRRFIVATVRAANCWVIFFTECVAYQRTPIANDLHGNVKVRRKSAWFAVGIYLEFSGIQHFSRRERRVKEFVVFVWRALGPCFRIACKYRWNKPHRNEIQSRLEETGVRCKPIELNSLQTNIVAPWNWPDTPQGQT